MLFLVCAAMLCNHAAWAQNRANNPIFQGYKITVDNGTGHVQEVVVNETEKARMKEAILAGEEYVPSNGAINPRPTTPVAATKQASENPVGDTNSSEQVEPLGMKLPDGRTLPFGVGGKTHDNSIDPHSALRSIGRRETNFSEQRYDKQNWNGLNMSSIGENRSNSISWEKWGTQFGAWGKRGNADIAMKDSLDAKQQDKPMLDRKTYDGKTSPWARQFAEIRNQDKRHSQDLNSQYLASGSISFKDRMLAQYKSMETLSMQDINRYQYRRNHPTNPGLPVATPTGTLHRDSFAAGQ